jgi:hypothetical protein
MPPECDCGKTLAFAGAYKLMVCEDCGPSKNCRGLPRDKEEAMDAYDELEWRFSRAMRWVDKAHEIIQYVRADGLPAGTQELADELLRDYGGLGRDS